jgi:hypothetical protein
MIPKSGIRFSDKIMVQQEEQGSERVQARGRPGSSTAKAATDRYKVGAAFCITPMHVAQKWLRFCDDDMHQHRPKARRMNPLRRDAV